MKLVATAPASAANLGPGFDALGLALGVANEVEIEAGVPPGVQVHGEGAGELPTDGTNLVVRAMAYLARELGGALPPMRMTCRNAIPLGRGMGSSAAAVVAGLLLADRLLGAGLDDDRLLEVAVDLEGHPDNVAACLRGGLVIAYLSRSGWRAASLAAHAGLRPVVLVPEHERVATEDARRVLPLQVPIRDAVHNAGRAALAVVALTADPGLLGEALEDRLHQARRLELAPAARALFADLRDADVPVCVSGSGPTLLAFESEGARVPELGPGWRVLRPGIGSGATVREA